jgi:hypothetical protein
MFIGSQRNQFLETASSILNQINNNVIFQQWQQWQLGRKAPLKHCNTVCCP